MLGHVMKRILGYMLKNYKFSFFMVVVCILGAALATLRGTLFMQSLIDDYIVPLTSARTPDFSSLAAAWGHWQSPTGWALCVPMPTTGLWSM